jgi:hypothetical protein
LKIGFSQENKLGAENLVIYGIRFRQVGYNN